MAQIVLDPKKLLGTTTKGMPIGTEKIGTDDPCDKIEPSNKPIRKGS
jgi:hypothetical protein